LAEVQEKDQKVSQQVNPDQVNAVLKFIDATQSEPVKESIFGKLGRECFSSRNLDAWVRSFDGVHGLIHWVNVEKKSRFWEELELNEENSVLKLTGKTGDRCACVFSDIADPPHSLCNYCCKYFQEELFSMLAGRRARVEITESIILGSNRCCTLIHFGEYSSSL